MEDLTLHDLELIYTILGVAQKGEALRYKGDVRISRLMIILLTKIEIAERNKE
mgnify:CR=1 FL=1